MSRKKKLKYLIDDYFINGRNLKLNEKYDIKYVDAKQFIVAQRADLICKLAYIDSKINNKNVSFAKDMYTAHICAFTNGTYTEPGQINKNSLQTYISTFDRMIEDIPKCGLSHQISVIPVSENNILLDGSHRIAIAIYFNLKAPIIVLPDLKICYDLQFFRDRGLSNEYLEYMANKLDNYL